MKNLKIKIYRSIILPVVLYGCETWSLTLREERKLRVFENMVLRRMFGPRRDEVTGEWRRLQIVCSSFSPQGHVELGTIYVHVFRYIHCHSHAPTLCR
jgi:hypothetical protein